MTHLNRRQVMTAGAGMAGALMLGGAASGVSSGGMAGAPGGEPVLPPLPYDYTALAPTLDKETLQLHHDKHHAGYVKGLVKTLDALEKARKAGDYGAIKHLSRDLAFHGSGHILHSIYWESMTPKKGTRPSEALAGAANRDFGSWEAMVAQFKAASKAVEGSGWGVLVFEPALGRLLILQAEKHQNLTVWGCVPLLVCDVWEHAYYPLYRNRRAEYVDRFCEIADWEKTSQRFEKATS